MCTFKDPGIILRHRNYEQLKKEDVERERLADEREEQNDQINS